MYGYPYEEMYGYPYWGPSWGFGFGWGGGRGWGRGWAFGRGFGWWSNPYTCARFPWLPRWWWTGMYGPITPFTGAPRMSNSPYYESPHDRYSTYTTSAPTAVIGTTYTPYYAPLYSPYPTLVTATPSMMYSSPYAASPYSTGAETPQIPKEQERQMLEGQATALQQQLDQIKKKLEELSGM